MKRIRSWLPYLLKIFGQGAGVPRRGRLGSSLTGIAIRLLLAGVLASVLGWWWTAHNTLASDAGMVFGLKRLTVEVPFDKTVEIGRAELMHPRGSDFAEARHIAIDHRSAGSNSGVFLRNVADQRRLSLRFGDERSGVTGFAERLVLSPGATPSIVHVGRAIVTFANVGPAKFDVTIDQGGAKRRYSLAISGVTEELTALPPLSGEAATAKPSICREPELLDGMFGLAAGAVIDWFPKLGPDERRVLLIGGTHSCKDQRLWQVGLGQEVAWRQLAVTYRWAQGKFYLVPGEPTRRNHLPIRFDGAIGAAGFTAIPWKLDGTDSAGHAAVSRFVAGRASYDIATTVDPRARVARVVVTPRDKTPVFSETKCGWARTGGARPAELPESDVVCPLPLPSSPVGKVTREVSEPFPILGRVAGSEALQLLSRDERRWRVGLILLALPLMAWCCRLGPAVISLFRREGRTAVPTLGGAVLAMMVTGVSCALALAPEIAALRGWSWFDGGWALAALLANWFFAGMLLLFVSEAGIMLGVLWVVVTMIVAIGSLAQASMAVDGDSTAWAAFFVKHKLLFLDVLPPFAATLAVVPLRAIRPVLQELVVANRATTTHGVVARLGYMAVRWSPLILLIGAFFAWLVFGGQQGVGGIQPVEAGKFAAVVICGVSLLWLMRTSRALAIQRGALRKFLSAAALLLFAFVLLASPIVRSDYSPVLVVGLLVGTLVLLRIVPTLLGKLGQYIDDYVERRRVPMRFRPRVTRPIFPFTIRPRLARGWAVTMLVAGTTLLGIVGVSAVVVWHGWILATLLRLDPAVWPDTREAQLSTLQHSLGHGRRIPVERMMIYLDQLYSAEATPQPGKTDPAFQVRFRDIGFQLIRSRVVIAHAGCHISNELLPPRAADHWPMRAASEILRAAEDLFIPSDSRGPLCADFPTAKPVNADDNTAAAGPSRRALLDKIAAIKIPVVQSDFAPAYLIGRHGAGTAAVLMAVQSALLLIFAFTYMRLRQTTQDDGPDAIVRHMLSVLVAGSAILLVLHWSISWSNVLGLMPVMGQPMTFLSAATSHHQFMALPCLLTLILGLRYAAYAPKIPSRRSPPPYLGRD